MSSSSMAAGLHSGEPQEIKGKKRSGRDEVGDFDPAELLFLIQSH